MIDVLLPFYGDPLLLGQAVESVKQQTCPDWRLIIVDDAYPDRRVQRFFSDDPDPRIEYHRNSTNLGANRNYTKALSLATAEHVVFMGADDLMCSSYVALMHEVIDRFPDGQAFQCGVEIVNDRAEAILPLGDRIKSFMRPRSKSPVCLQGEDVITSLLHGNWTYFPSLCWQRNPVNDLGFRTDFDVVQDLALLVDLLRTGAGLTVVPEIAFKYRRHANSDSSLKSIGGGQRFIEERRYFEQIAGELAAEGYHRAARAARWHLTSRLHAATLVPGALKAGKPMEARALVRHSIG